MERPCPFWPDDRMCASKECGIESCDDEVPAALRRPQQLAVVRFAERRTIKAAAKNATAAADASAHQNRTLTLTTSSSTTTSTSTSTSSSAEAAAASAAAPTCSKSPHGAAATFSTSIANVAYAHARAHSNAFDSRARLQSDKDAEEKSACVGGSNQFDPLDRSLTAGDVAQLAEMEEFEDTSNRFCDVEGASVNSHFMASKRAS